MIRSKYEHELSELNIEIIKMGSLVEKAIEDSITAFKNNDLMLCEDVISRDKKIDEIEKIIESKCLWLIAKEQPVATDLRNITTALKMITDLERIGDNAADIAELTMRITERNTFSESPHITQMAAIVILMVKDAVSAYVNADLESARQMDERDDAVDDFFNIIKNELVIVFKKGEADIDNAIDYLQIAKYLERIADHAVNICEWIEFSKTGIHKKTKIF
jgi:phosphate transport system protein